MDKQLKIIDENLMEEFISLFSIGLLESIKAGIIEPERAEQWLFSPVIAYSSKMEKYSKELRHALDFASETYAAKKSTNFEQGLEENINLFFNIVEKIPKNNFGGRSFIKGII